jgi:thymidylate kinase
LSEYDYVIQDRGILSGLAYGSACGNDPSILMYLAGYVTTGKEDPELESVRGLYDSIIYLKGDTSAGLKKALQSKQEFAQGDAMEARGNSFLQTVSSNMDEQSQLFNTKVVNVDGKSIEEVFSDILLALDLKDK